MSGWTIPQKNKMNFEMLENSILLKSFKILTHRFKSLTRDGNNRARSRYPNERKAKRWIAFVFN